MDSDLILLIIVFVCSNLLVMGLSFPLILRRIPPNGLYGFRVPSTMNNEPLWYDVNTYAGKRLLAASFASLVMSIVFAFIQTNLDAYALLCLGVFCLSFGWTIISSLYYLSKIKHRYE